jgi:MFS family permease
MNTEFGALAQARYRSRSGRRRVYVIAGLVLVTFGYFLMAVNPQTAPDWVLFRATGGLACIVVGCWLAILPLLSAWTSDQ